MENTGARRKWPPPPAASATSQCSPRKPSSHSQPSSIAVPPGPQAPGASAAGGGAGWTTAGASAGAEDSASSQCMPVKPAVHVHCSCGWPKIDIKVHSPPFWHGVGTHGTLGHLSAAASITPLTVAPFKAASPKGPLRSSAQAVRMGSRTAAHLGERDPLSQGVQTRRKALRLRHINGTEVRKKRPRGFKKRPRGFK